MSAPAILGDRSLFPLLQADVYANHAAVSPLSAPVVDAIAATAQSYARHGLGALPQVLDHRAGLAEDLAALVSVAPADIAWVANTSTGVIDIAWGMDWRRGDRVVLFEGEFPSNVTPWLQAAEHFDLKVEWIGADGFGDGSGRGLQRFDELMAGARLAAVSAVRFQSGLRMPVEAMARICRRRGARLFVDAIQAVGATPLDLSAVDFASFGSHKWTMGPEGAAALIVRPDAADDLRPRLAGWMSHQDPFDFLSGGPGLLRPARPLQSGPGWAQVGAASALTFAGWRTAVGLIRGLGVVAIAGHLQRWHDRLEPLLHARGFASLRAGDPAGRSGSLCLRPPRGVDGGQLQRLLSDAGVACSYPDGCLRFAPHWPSSLDEALQIDGAVASALGLARS